MSFWRLSASGALKKGRQLLFDGQSDDFRWLQSSLQDGSWRRTSTKRSTRKVVAAGAAAIYVEFEAASLSQLNGESRCHWQHFLRPRIIFLSWIFVGFLTNIDFNEHLIVSPRPPALSLSYFIFWFLFECGNLFIYYGPGPLAYYSPIIARVSLCCSQSLLALKRCLIVL